MGLLAGAVVDKLVGGSHGGQRMRAGVDFLIKRVGVEGAGCYVGHGLGHLKIFVAQLTHVVELVGEERKNILVGSGVYGDRGESESLLCLRAISCEPVFGEGVAALDGVFQSGMPFPYLGHGFDARGDKILGEAGSGNGGSRSVCSGTGQGQDNLIPVEADGAVGEAGEAFDFDVVAAVNLDDDGGARLSGDDERVALLRGEGTTPGWQDEESKCQPGFDGVDTHGMDLREGLPIVP